MHMGVICIVQTEITKRQLLL